MSLQVTSRVSILGALFLLGACAGSPVHTSGLPEDKLRKVSDSTLCQAWCPRSSYYPRAGIHNQYAMSAAI